MSLLLLPEASKGTPLPSSLWVGTPDLMQKARVLRPGYDAQRFHYPQGQCFSGEEIHFEFLCVTHSTEDRTEFGKTRDGGPGDHELREGKIKASWRNF